MRALQVGACACCGKSFTRKTVPVRGFCGRECYHASRKGRETTTEKLPEVPAHLLPQCFGVDPLTGSIWRIERPREHFCSERAWKISKSNVGQPATSSSGLYLAVGLNYLGHAYKLMAHRVVWAFVHGRWPSLIDHRDGNGKNNRIDNLREATPQQNMANKRGWGSSGLKGVYRRANGTFCGRIKVGNKSFHLGTYKTAKEAREAYAAAARLHHGEFSSC